MIPGVDYVAITTPFYCHDGEGNFLLHKRSKNCRDEIGRWDPGSGKLEFGLTIEENVLKEVKEEYGVLGKIMEFLPPHHIFRKQKGKSTHWLAIPAFVLVDPAKVKNGEPDKIDEIGWFELKKLPKPLHTGFNITFTKFPEFFKKYYK